MKDNIDCCMKISVRRKGGYVVSLKYRENTIKTTLIFRNGCWGCISGKKLPHDLYRLFLKNYEFAAPRKPVCIDTFSREVSKGSGVARRQKKTLDLPSVAQCAQEVDDAILAQQERGVDPDVLRKIGY